MSDMELTATITTGEPHAKMRKLFASELVRRHERSSIALEDKGGKAVFRITANDTTALRAAMNTVTSTLGMHEKTLEATNDRHF